MCEMEGLLGMKTTRFVVIFLLFISVYVLLFSFKESQFANVVNKKAEYNKSLDSALDAALEGIVESADGNSVIVDKDACVSNFYNCLYASFNALDSETTQAMLKLYTPILAVADEDGLYVYYSDTVNGEVQKVWSQKIPYTRHFTTTSVDATGAVGYTVNFQLDDTVTIKIDGDDSIYSGRYSELVKNYANATGSEYKAIRAVLAGEVFSAEGYFELWRSQVITECITDKLSYYVNRHNRIAAMYGEQFTFQLPVSASSDISRSISNVSFMCFFQGYPYGSATSDVYSNFEISGAHVTKNSGYYTRVVDGYLYYHKPSCNKGSGEQNWYATQEECAWAGALPCPYCNP